MMDYTQEVTRDVIHAWGVLPRPSLTRHLVHGGALEVLEVGEGQAVFKLDNIS